MIYLLSLLFTASFALDCTPFVDKIETTNQNCCAGCTHPFKCPGNGGCYSEETKWQCSGGVCPALSSDISSDACPGLPDPVESCEKLWYWAQRDDQPWHHCKNSPKWSKSDPWNCLKEGWFSKTNDTPGTMGIQTQFIDADKICKEQGYIEGADPEKWGYNHWKKCTHPGAHRDDYPKANAGSLHAMGKAVVFKCKGERYGPCAGGRQPPNPTPKPVATPEPSNAPTRPCGRWGKGKLGRIGQTKLASKKMSAEGTDVCDCDDYCLGNASGFKYFDFKAPLTKKKKGKTKTKAGKCNCYTGSKVSSFKPSKKKKKAAGGPLLEDYCIETGKCDK